MSPLSCNTQRQGVLMAPVWVPERPLVAALRISRYCHPVAIIGHSMEEEEWGGKGEGGWMWVVWVLWKDVWNGSMGIKGFGSVGGLLCWRLSPLLASMISSIDTESLLRSSVCFCQPLSHFLSLALLGSLYIWVTAKESGELFSLLLDLTKFILVAGNCNDDRSL